MLSETGSVEPIALGRMPGILLWAEAANRGRNEASDRTQRSQTATPACHQRNIAEPRSRLT